MANKKSIRADMNKLIKELNGSRCYGTTPISVVRSNRIEAGKCYVVEIHGVGMKWMKAEHVPSVPLTKMTEKDRFVFGSRNGRGEKLELKTHGTGGPQFLVARVPAKRGDGEANARVTFYEKAKHEDEPGASKKAA